MSLNKGDYMSNTKHLADMLKVCSILPVFAVMPAMATIPDGYVESTEQSIKAPVNIVGKTYENSYVRSPEGTALEKQNLTNLYFSHGKKTSTIKDTVFRNNNTELGGALATAGGGNVVPGELGGNQTELFVENSSFIGNSALYDAGAIGNYGFLTIGQGVVFEQNVSVNGYNTPDYMGGGALGLGSLSTTIIAEGTKFIGNYSGTYGGAISTRRSENGDNHIAKADIQGEFEDNEAKYHGGAIFNTFYVDNGLGKGAGVTVDGDFYRNNAGGSGGAIYNDGTKDLGGLSGGVMTVNNSNFSYNTAGNEGGAIFNSGTMDISGGEFVGNKVENGYGGAIKNSGTMTITDANFYDNIAYVNGAVATSLKDAVETTIIGGRFEGNHAFADGGALGLYSIASVNGTWFVDNSAGMDKKIGDTVYEKAYDTNGGGALFVGEKAKATLSNVHFYDNETGVNGGAIHARHGGLDGKNGAYLNIDVAEFDDNEAENYGGAISNIYGGVINISNAKFTLNEAGKSGGAIYNGVGENWGSADTPSLSSGNGTINFTNVQFIDNEAGENGGAIYNDTKGTMTFAGINTFANNKKHVGKYVTTNDIHNLGNISVVSGTTTLSGGVTGTGTFTIAEGAELYIGSSKIDQSSIVIDGTVFADVLTDGSSAYIDRAEKPENMRENNGGTYAKLLGNVTGSGSINLNIGSVGTYEMFSQENDVTINAGKAYEVTKDGTDVKIALKSVEKMAGDTGLSQRAAGAISSLATSSNRGMQRVSLAAQKLLNSDDPDAIAKIEQETAKLNPEDKPVTQSVTTSLNNQVLSLTAGRMSGGAPMVGRSGGDNGESGIWMQGLYNQSKSGDAFDGKTRGFALGADTLVANKYTLGLGFAYNNTDVSSGTRDTEIDSKTLFLYGQYKPNKWFANATLAYTMSEYTENTDPLGFSIENTYDVDAYGAQLMTGYDFATGITTEMGMRYLHIAQEEYESAGKPVAAQDTDFLTAVAGLKYAFYVQTDDALKFRPELRAALTYDVINDDNHATVMLPGVGTSYNVDGKALNKLGGEFGIGLTAEYKGMEFSVMYDLDLHEDYTSQTGMIKFRGRF
jgi:predicted outer membrane repeat protein